MSRSAAEPVSWVRGRTKQAVFLLHRHSVSEYTFCVFILNRLPRENGG